MYCEILILQLRYFPEERMFANACQEQSGESSAAFREMNKSAHAENGDICMCCEKQGVCRRNKSSMS